MATQTQAKGQQAAPVSLPFRVGAQPEANQDFVPAAVTLGTGTQPLPVYHPSAESFLRGVWIQVAALTSGNVGRHRGPEGRWPVQRPEHDLVHRRAAEVHCRPDQRLRPHGHQQVRRLLQLQSDPRADANYSFTASGGTGGSFNFALYLPLEWDLRTGMGSLVNKSTASTFSVNVTLETNSNVYSTAPTSPRPSR